MSRNRKSKLIILIALVVSVCAMSIGFAAFSATLTISSSARVTPDDSGFVIKMFGWTGLTYEEQFDLNKYNSETSANMIKTDESMDFTLHDNVSSIDNNSLSLSLGELEVTEPGVYGTVVKVENRGNYDAYLDTSKLNFKMNGSCVAGSETSEALVNEACQSISSELYLYTKDTFLSGKDAEDGKITWDEYYEIEAQDCFYVHNNICKLKKGDSIIMGVGVYYVNEDGDFEATPRADGPFSVSFPDIKLEFTTDSTGYMEE